MFEFEMADDQIDGRTAYASVEAAIFDGRERCRSYGILSRAEVSTLVVDSSNLCRGERLWECRCERPADRAVSAQSARAQNLERQVRRHRVAMSLFERCRAILRCARRFLKDRCDGLPDEAHPWRPAPLANGMIGSHRLALQATPRTIDDDQC